MQGQECSKGLRQGTKKMEDDLIAQLELHIHS